MFRWFHCWSADLITRLCSKGIWPSVSRQSFKGVSLSRSRVCVSVQTTVIEYVKPSDLKKDMNETFKEKFPHIKLTLSKIRRYIPLWFLNLPPVSFQSHVGITCYAQTSVRISDCLLVLSSSLKREMRAVSEECGLQPVTISMAFVYFEKLVLQGRLNKQNRKLVAAACVLLAAKISSDLRKPEVKQLIDVSKASMHIWR